MATDIRVIHASEFLKATPEGPLDVTLAKRLLVQIPSAAGPASTFEVLVDTRRTQSDMSAADLWNVAAELGRLRSVFSRKTAVLCPLEHFDRAAFMAFCARERGLRVKAFTSYEDAFEWLFTEGA